VLPANAFNDVRMLPLGKHAGVGRLAIRLAPGTGSVECLVARQAF
jgi:hypothetical protein